MINAEMKDAKQKEFQQVFWYCGILLVKILSPRVPDWEEDIFSQFHCSGVLLCCCVVL